MAQRQYEPATVFNARIADMRHLWIPSEMYKGQKTQKPNYFAMFLAKKTAATWFAEPALAGITQACSKIYQNAPHVVQWPVIDGDMPSPEGKSSEFAKGHWLFSASTGNPPTVEIAQANGSLTRLTSRAGVKSGDYVMVGVTAAVKQNDPRGVKLYLNTIVFSSPGEEIVFANSVSGAELMQQAQRQGLQVAGFSAPSTGFAPQGAPGFTPGNPPPSFGAATPGGFAPPAAPVHFGAPAPGTGSAMSPFSGAAPVNPFAPR
jgi:Enterobacter phage Enc34, ssDNA-binding protein